MAAAVGGLYVPQQNTTIKVAWVVFCCSLRLTPLRFAPARFEAIEGWETSEPLPHLY